MVVISVLSVDNICESFTHNPLTQSQVKPTFLSLMEIHNECIANARKFESYFGGGKHVCACIAMDGQPYALHSPIMFFPTNKTGTLIGIPPQPHSQRHHRRRPMIPKQPPRLSPSLKNMSITLMKISVAAID